MKIPANKIEENYNKFNNINKRNERKIMARFRKSKEGESKLFYNILKKN